MALVHIVTNLENTWGLSKDVRIMKQLLIAAGHDVGLAQWNKQLSLGRKPDITIHVEMVGGFHFYPESKNILIPNPEWFLPMWYNRRGRFHATFAKTQFTQQLFRDKFGFRNVQFTSFTSEDRLLPNSTRQPFALHIAGNSMFKNTIPLVQHWQKTYPTLHVYASQPDLIKTIQKENKNNVVLHTKHVPDEEITYMLNTAQWVIQPSAAEGFGHCIVEPMSTGAVVIGLDGEPMNEFPTLNLPARQTGKHHYGNVYTIDRFDRLSEFLEQTDGSANRTWWEQNDTFFKTKFIKELEKLL